MVTDAERREATSRSDPGEGEWGGRSKVTLVDFLKMAPC